MPRDVDDDFTALPLHALADAALDRARELGASHADVRIERGRSLMVRLRDGALEGANDTTDLGLSVRVVVDGTWGFAARVDLDVDAAVAAAGSAIELAKVSRPVNSEPVELAAEPVHANATWVSAYDIDPFTVGDTEIVELLGSRCRAVLDVDGIDHVDAAVLAVKEQKFYADLAGSSTTQQRVRLHADVTAVAIDKDTGAFETMRTVAPPVGRGWEYVLGASHGGWDWDAELAELPERLIERLHAPSVEPGTYDLVIHPSNLWLTIHESVGHATELDRALGYEANYAGTTFATFDQLGSLQYGSAAMTVTGDRIVEHGLATVGYDDEGVAAQQWDLVRDGTLVGYQLDRRMASLKGFDRSNGCAYADSAGHVPVQRMPNVSLAAAQDGPSTEELIGRVERGLFVVGDKSWSIDMQRFNFQFTAQRFFRIEGGRLAGQVKDAAYQANTLKFWNSLEAVGGAQTYVLGGAFNCGKAQPGQVAAVSHGCPTSLFRQINVLNTVQESGR
ncbi:MAG: TldD/PmbA family protein [Candidatus Nanopelagicales bacterium]